MFKKVWSWFVGNCSAIRNVCLVLLLGASLAPVAEAGQGFVKALQFEKMAEASPVYAVVRDVELQTQYYVLSVENVENMTVLWVLPAEDRTYEREEVNRELYIVFASLAEHCPAEDYIIAEAYLTEVPSMNGFIPAFRGKGFFALPAEGVRLLIEGGIENAYDSLTVLFAAGMFEAKALEEEAVYMTNLLPRASGHAAPWEDE
jgi:hypothetical protein